MHQAIKLTLTKPETRRGRASVAKLIKSLDDLLESYEVSPVIWITKELDGEMLFTAFIPPDCFPEFDLVADLLSSRFNKYRKQNTE